MASGTLGTPTTLNQTTYTSTYTVPVGKTATFSINFCNKNPVPARVRLAVTAAANGVAAGEFYDYDQVIDPTGSYERSGLVASAGKNVTFYSDVANIDVNVYGFEE